MFLFPFFGLLGTRVLPPLVFILVHLWYAPAVFTLLWFGPITEQYNYQSSFP